jgi:ATP-dependent DNA helicase RecG
VKKADLLAEIALGEDSTRQFKKDVRNGESLASEMAAFANADELPTRADIGKLDKLRFRDFLRDFYKQDFPDDPDELKRLLRNMNLADEAGFLSLAGVLLFAERPEWIKPQFVIKAIRYPGNDIHVSDYLDTEDFDGPLRRMFDSALAFVMRNLHKIQAGRGVNAPGLPEIPESVFEELLVNALIHRDYLVSAPIRLFIFDNRIEIISPGHLPNNLTVERIRAGISNIRNPILVSFVAKGLLPYHGLGSGIKRALEAWPDIEFTDDRDGCQFTVTVHRKKAGSPGKGSVKLSVKPTISGEVSEKPSGKGSPKSSSKTEDRIIEFIKLDGFITTERLGRSLGISKRAVLKQIHKLKVKDRLRRIGPAKGGHWEIVEKDEK